MLTLFLTALLPTLTHSFTVPPPDHLRPLYHITPSQNHCIDPTKCTCAEISLSAANWTAIDFRYYYTSDPATSDPQRASSLTLTSIDFSVVNIAIQNTTHCAYKIGKGEEKALDPAEWYQCDMSTRSPVTFRFNASAGVLELKQDWWCDREAPSRVWVTGNVTVPMSCQGTAAGLARGSEVGRRGLVARDPGVLCDMANFTVPWLEIAASG